MATCSSSALYTNFKGRSVSAMLAQRGGSTGHWRNLAAGALSPVGPSHSLALLQQDTTDDFYTTPVHQGKGLLQAVVTHSTDTLVVVASKYNSADSGIDYGPGAENAGLSGAVKCSACHFRASQNLARLPYSYDFAMGGGIQVRFHSISGRPKTWPAFLIAMTSPWAVASRSGSTVLCAFAMT